MASIGSDGHNSPGRPRRAAIRSAIWACALLMFASVACAQDYLVSKFPTLGGRLTRAFAINEHGQVAGTASLASGQGHAFLWTRTGGVQDLGTLGGSGSVAYGINASGQVVGQADTPGAGHAFLWSQAQGMRDLGAIAAYSTASGINNNGDVVGSSETGNGTTVTAILWPQSGGMQDLGTLGLGSYATGINDSGQVVGTCSFADGSSHAFLWTQADGMQDLGTLGGTNSFGSAINSSGQVVGVSDTGGGVEHAFLWTQAGGMKDLGAPAGLTNSQAWGLSESGKVVGSAWSPGVKGSPFLWTEKGGMKGLGPFGKIAITDGNAINGAGQILASLYASVGYSSYLLTPAMVTTLTSSSNPLGVGQPVTFRVTVNSAAVGRPPNAENVSLNDGKTVLAVLPLTDGSATFSTSSLVAGTHALQAAYPGDDNYVASKSSILEQVVTGNSSSTILASSLNPSKYGQAVTWTARATTTGTAAPTGSVTFQWSQDGQNHTIGTATLNASGVAALTKATLNANAYAITAVYMGDGSTNGSASAILNQLVTQTTSTAAITSSQNPSTQGQGVTFTATISSPTVTAKGPVTFSSGTTVLGTAQLSGGKAKITVATLPPGSNRITVTYLGDSNIAKCSASLTQQVQ